MNRVLLPTALAVLALGLAGCGGSTTTTPATGVSTAASSSAGAPSSAAAPASASPSSAADVDDPCTVLDAAAVAKATGVKVGTGTPTDVSGSKLCTWTPSDPSDGDAALFTAQEGPAQGGSLSDAEGPLKKQFGGKVTTIDVAGAEDARYITGKTAGASVIDVLALKDGVFYQVLAASPRGDVEQHKGGVTAMVEALIKA